MHTVHVRRNASMILIVCFMLLYVNLIYYRSKALWYNYEKITDDVSPIKDYNREDITDDDSIFVNTSLADELMKKIKVFCFITTTTKNVLSKAKAVNDTWGKRCDKILFVSSSPSSIPMTISFNIIDNRNHLTSKTVSMLEYIYKYSLTNFDWFIKADDDTYVVMENLKFLLSKYDQQKPIYLGQHFKMHVRQGYMSGGAGYVMSAPAIKLFIEEGVNKNICSKDGNDEDVDVGKCLERVGVKPYSTVDKFGRETFHAFSLLSNIIGPAPLHLLQYPHKPAKVGKNCCSQLPITFHYTSAKMMYLIEFFLYRTAVYGRQLGQIDDDFFKEEVSELDKDPSVILLPGSGRHNQLILITPSPKSES